MQCGAGVPVDELDEALGRARARRWRSRRPARSAERSPSVAAGSAGSGTGRSATRVLQARYVNAEGEVVKAGGPTVKNVSGFDLCRLLVGSRGTLGFIGEVILRTRPLATFEQWYVADDRSVRAVPAAVPADVGAVGRQIGVGAARGAPRRRRRASRCARPARRRSARRLPAGGRWSLPPARLRELPGGWPVRRRDRRRHRAPRVAATARATSTRRSSSCTGGSSTSSTRPAVSTPVSTCSRPVDRCRRGRSSTSRSAMSTLRGRSPRG